MKRGIAPAARATAKTIAWSSLLLLALVGSHAAWSAETAGDTMAAETAAETAALEQQLEALAGERDDGLHVDVVEIGAFFAIDLHVDEVVVHVGGGGFVFEGLVLHDVAPVAGGVADAHEDGFVFFAGAGECGVSPGIPVHGIVGVLEEVGAGLVDEFVDVQRGAAFGFGHGWGLLAGVGFGRAHGGGQDEWNDGSAVQHKCSESGNKAGPNGMPGRFFRGNSSLARSVPNSV